ncbi:DUF397 domain-containing protein [Prauserella marina]|uniref:Uncharacterized protein n=1 Tax=Prauserella marina TaxID=530584 RepID=A0A222VL60_9PSEU|nr:DUF397 domain-containing protein [Prauserella marina]ASR34572.1 DUF397 domain-containing protein [Prauserella marina]PWV85805.1 uncharacterized protein DUF397 [Prauserella marina]SDC45076.1 protein of unknown function [Prauserella marina]
MVDDLSRASWRKSTYSGGGNDCVEVAFLNEGMAVRDSKNPKAGALRLPESEWKLLMAAARSGSLDLR